MKTFLKLFFLGMIAFATVTVFATNRTKTVSGPVNQGEYKLAGGGTADTIVVADTVSYIYLVAHANDVWPEFDIKYQKIGTGNPTLKIDIMQSIDGVNYFSVKKGKAKSDYTKSYSPTATGYLQCSFRNDTAYFTGRYLKMQFSTSNTASTKAKLTNHLKVNVD
jgi:hypothetical protein